VESVSKRWAALQAAYLAWASRALPPADPAGRPGAAGLPETPLPSTWRRPRRCCGSTGAACCS